MRAKDLGLRVRVLNVTPLAPGASDTLKLRTRRSDFKLLLPKCNAVLCHYAEAFTAPWTYSTSFCEKNG